MKPVTIHVRPPAPPPPGFIELCRLGSEARRQCFAQMCAEELPFLERSGTLPARPGELDPRAVSVPVAPALYGRLQRLATIVAEPLTTVARAVVILGSAVRSERMELEVEFRDLMLHGDPALLSTHVLRLVVAAAKDRTPVGEPGLLSAIMALDTKNTELQQRVQVLEQHVQLQASSESIAAVRSMTAEDLRRLRRNELFNIALGLGLHPNRSSTTADLVGLIVRSRT